MHFPPDPDSNNPVFSDKSIVNTKQRIIESIDWKLIPAGDCFLDQTNSHHILSYEISSFPVTESQFQCFIDERGYDNPRWWEGLSPWAKDAPPQRKPQGDNPVTWVSWHEAMAFCRWLSDKTGCVIRLPTEYEWIRAARGNETWEYPWGNDYQLGFANLNEKAEHLHGNYHGQTLPFEDNPNDVSLFGVHGLTGNVQEWCLGDASNPPHPRPIRGGAYISSPRRAKISVANFANPDLRSPTIGFRLVREVTNLSLKMPSLSPVESLIAEEAIALTGDLDLSELDILQLPDSLFELRHLRILVLRGNWEITDLSRISELSNLQELDCSETRIADLSPLTGLAQLNTLDCYETLVSDLSPLAGLIALQSINCMATLVNDLSPLSKLSRLKSLDCSKTKTSDLIPLVGLEFLQSLDCTGCYITKAPPIIWDKPSLEEVFLFETKLPEVPPEILSQDSLDNCLARLRGYFRDLQYSTEKVRDIKLIVLGNGRVGKTQICRWLRGELFQEDSDPTHGIDVSSAPIISGNPSAGIWKIWDFGGQDIYHGTHALFMRTRAVFLVVWSPEFEKNDEQPQGEMFSRNYPLSYWLEYIRNLAGDNSPVIVVQTRCDKHNDEASLTPDIAESLQRFAFGKHRHFSSKNDRQGRLGLQEELVNATDWLREKESYSISGRWLAVQRKIEALQNDDKVRSPNQRQYHTIEREKFEKLCQEMGGDIAQDDLLDYLHQTSVVFYRQGFFNNRIVLDLTWALKAIYAIFERNEYYQELLNERGVFKRSFVQASVWQRYSIEEQLLFLDMMLSCRICFVYKEAESKQVNDATKYIAPEFLPDNTEIENELAAIWGMPDETNLVAVCEKSFFYNWLHLGLWRDVIAYLGTEAKTCAVYWKDGICFYESETMSRALIERIQDDGDWSGKIRISTKHGNALELLNILTGRIRQAQDHWGLKGEESSPTVIPVHSTQKLMISHEKKIGISYAWFNQNTEQYKLTQEIIQCIQKNAETKRITVIRDETNLEPNEIIEGFMEQLIETERVAVLLTAKYLERPNCMYELTQLWRHRFGKDTKFLEKARVYVFPCCAEIYCKERDKEDKTVIDKHIKFWETEKSKADNAAKDRLLSTIPIGEHLTATHYSMICESVGEILYAIQRSYHPPDVEGFVQNLLDGL